MKRCINVLFAIALVAAIGWNATLRSQTIVGDCQIPRIVSTNQIAFWAQSGDSESLTRWLDGIRNGIACLQAQAIEAASIIEAAERGEEEGDRPVPVRVLSYRKTRRGSTIITGLPPNRRWRLVDGLGNEKFSRSNALGEIRLLTTNQTFQIDGRIEVWGSDGVYYGEVDVVP